MSSPSTPRSRKKPPSSQTSPSSLFSDPYILDRSTSKITLRPHDTVQLFDRSLLTIEHFEHQFDEKSPTDPFSHDLIITVYAVGRRYLRFRECEDLAGFLANDPREVYKSELRERISVQEVYRKVTLRKTNLLYPALQSHTKFTCRYSRRGNSVVSLSPDRADPGRTRVSDPQKRNTFIYGDKVPPAPESRYHFGDAFCGVGGTSAGARMAGLTTRWAFDSDNRTAQVYAQNFP